MERNLNIKNSMENEVMNHPEMEPATERIKEKNRHIFRRALLFFFVVFLVSGAFWYGYQNGQDALLSSGNQPVLLRNATFVNTENKKEAIDFSLFWKVWDLLKQKYVDKDKLDAQKLFYGAISGMLAATGDPYTTFFDPAENKSFTEDITGTFDGIGAEMGFRNAILTIIAPLDDSPAVKAGLRAGDKILKIDGVNTSNMSIDEAVTKIRGPKGTSVKFSIFRDGEDAARDIAVTRDTIVVKSVKLDMKGTVAVIRVSRFGDDTNALFDTAIDSATVKKATGIVLDLRNDPGGYLDAAVHLAGRMLPIGDVAVIEESGDGTRQETKVNGKDVASGIPTVVLIDQGSASASEILAGALRDNRDNVTLVGEKSFGKGSVQELIPLGKDMSVKITVARWLTPKGDQINEVGIPPTDEVKLTKEDFDAGRDPQMDKALEILKGK